AGDPALVGAGDDLLTLPAPRAIRIARAVSLGHAVGQPASATGGVRRATRAVGDQACPVRPEHSAQRGAVAPWIARASMVGVSEYVERVELGAVLGTRRRGGVVRLTV